MEVIAGLITAVAVVGLGYVTRQGQSLPFYSTVLIVIALAYVLFAVMAEGLRTILIETAVAAGFVAVVVAAARGTNRRGAAGLVAAGLVAHGGYDLLHHAVVVNPVVPAWWPLYCGVVDVAMGGWVGWLFVGNRTPPAQQGQQGAGGHIE
jgi:hypothetical protein